MVKVAQLGIALGLLGIVISLIGLFPGMIALPPTPGFGVAQIFITLVGFTTLVLGALLYVKFAFYAGKSHTLAQQVGIRLSLTGITFAALAGLADVLGFGSNLRSEGSEELVGPIQMIALLLCFGVAALGVMLYAIAGDPDPIED